ncbi:anti-sigma factor [Corynebacterium macclintockiae]|uniref:anti-sigma factor n=1 Tax=Corynebacterium macclintockiae TaxID=2913501 RepID=UPI003EC533FF
MKDEKPDFGELEADLAGLAEPVEPSPKLKSEIMDAIASGKFPQFAPGEGSAEKSEENNEESNVVPLAKAAADSSAAEDESIKPRGGFARVGFAAAAAVVLLAGVGIVGTTTGLWGSSGEDSSLAENGAKQPAEGGQGDSPEALSDGGGAETFMQGAEAEDHMHSIMAMGDARSISLKADGSTLDVVISEQMDSGGAMVNGAPVLKNGMGAQVWSIDKHGAARSAGVIDQDPHDNVWMPLPADTMMVRVTEEPMAGSKSPGGTVLAEGKL